MLDTLKALADPCRLRLISVLMAGEFTVQELTRIMGMGQSRISRHLKILTESGVLSVKRQGTWSYYRTGDGSSFFNAIRQALENELKSLPEHNHDLTAVANILEVRRKRSQEFFDKHACQWDDLARTLLPLPEYRHLLLDVVPEAGTTLEIGIGTGGLLTELTKRADNVIGVDHSPTMLEESRRKLACEGISNVDLRLGEMTHLPIVDRTADCTILNMVLHHAAAPQLVLSEICRVLKPGGMLIIADLARHELEAAREQLADQWLGFDELELSNMLASTGFTEINCILIPGITGQLNVLLVTASKQGEFPTGHKSS